MNTVERVKVICRERKIPLSRLERDCGFANGYIGQLKKGTIPDDRLKIIADYFKIPVYELLGVPISGHHSEYYINDEVAEIAQEIYDDPDLHMLFSALRGSSKKSLQAMREMVEGFKETNPDG